MPFAVLEPDDPHVPTTGIFGIPFAAGFNTLTPAEGMCLSRDIRLVLHLIFTCAYCSSSSIVTFTSAFDIMGQAISSTQFFLYGKRHFTKVR